MPRTAPHRFRRHRLPPADSPLSFEVRTWVLALCTAGCLVLVWALWPALPEPQASAEAGAGRAASSPWRPDAPAEAAGAAVSPPAPQREEAVPAQPDCDTFDGYLRRLVALALATSEHVEAGDREAAQASDEQARELFAEMVRCIADPGEPALFTLTGLLSEDVSLAGRARRRVCLMALGWDLERRLLRHRTGGDREPLDRLAGQVLAQLPQDEVLARELGQILTNKPYLGLAHEEAVLGLLELSREAPFLIPIAADLLATLWRNLEAEGARTASELAALALLYKDESNAAKRLAAFRQLLTGSDPRFRQLALDEVRRSGDRELIRELALVAAEELDPEEAFEILDSLRASAADLLPALLTLGHRRGELLVRAYEQNLADDVEPGLRAELVSSAGFARTPEGLELARLAFQADPDPDVRTRALFVLTAMSPETLGEQAIQSALDDPLFRDDPVRLGALVMALENLARAGLPNAVDRIGRRLQAGNLLDADRRTLDRLLARALPGGRTSDR